MGTSEDYAQNQIAVLNDRLNEALAENERLKNLIQHLENAMGIQHPGSQMDMDTPTPMPINVL